MDGEQSITEQIKMKTGQPGRAADALRHAYHAVFAYPDTERPWLREAIKAGNRALVDHHHDAIMSSSPHPTCHRIAAALQLRWGLPWLADFRDGWTLNHNYPYGRVREFFERRLELATLAGASRITAANPRQASLQSKLCGKPTDTIPNGFDPESVNEPPVPVSAKFTITYTGSIYKGKQDPDKALAALAGLIQTKQIDPAKTELRFVGQSSALLEAAIRRNGLGNVATQAGPVPRPQALAEQRRAQVLLLADWEDPREADAVYPTKFFEYLAARRPILLTGGPPDSALKQLLERTRAGTCAQSTDDAHNALLKMYEAFEANGEVPFDGDQHETDEFSYRNAARKFSSSLDKAVAASQLR